MKYVTRHNFHSRLALAIVASMSEAGAEVTAEADATTTAAAAGSITGGASTTAEVPAHVAPNKFDHSFYFRSVKDTPNNREEIAKLGTVQELPPEEEGGETFIRRSTEKYTFVLPEVNTGDTKLDVVMTEIIKREIISAANSYVKKGEVPPPEKLTWPAIVEAKYIAITTAATDDDSGSGFNAALLKEVAGKFSNYMKAIGRDEAGTQIMAKMITGRFSIITTHKYIKGLPMVAANIEKWLLEGCSEEEQAAYGDVAQYLLNQAEKAQKPQEVETGTLFG